MRRRWGALGLVVALVAAACGGGNGGSAAAEGPDAKEVAAAANILVDRWDDEPAFFAVIASFDHGYSVSQVVEHPADLAADGTIPGVDSAGPPLGILSPLPDADASAAGGTRLVGAPRRLILAARAELFPQNQFVDFVDASLGEIFDAGQASLARQAEFEEFEESIVQVTLMLGASGYTAEQIVEAIITASLDFAAPDSGAIPCVIVSDGDGPVAPRGTPSAAFQSRCSGVFATTATTSTTTTTTAASEGAETGSIDGTYIGTVELVTDLPDYTLIDSVLLVTIDRSQVTMSLEFTLHWVLRYQNDAPVCTVTAKYTGTDAGTITTPPDFALTFASGTVEVLAAEGPECGASPDWDGITAEQAVIQDQAEDDSESVVDFRVVDGILTGADRDGFLIFTAQRS